jgi:SP family sugar:H+ symporter-like MFS transporter
MPPAAMGGGIGADAPKNKIAGIAMTAFSAFGGILYGYDTGIINGVIAMNDWTHTFGHPMPTAADPTAWGVTSSTQSLVVSVLSAGTFFGALLGAPLGDIFGRKWSIVFACLVFSVGVAMQTAAVHIPLFVVGRVIAGLGVGIVSCLVPLYQSECSPKWIRGAVVALYQWAITIGILLASVINNATQARASHAAYRIPISVQFVWAFILAVGMAVLPESPRWLIRQGRFDDAAKSLGRLTSLQPSDPVVQAEMKLIRDNLEAELALGGGSYMDCFRFSHNKIALRTWTGILIQAWQQLTGINFIFYYGTQFFENAGIKNAFLISIATSVVNVFMTLPGLYGVERYGRRSLLLIGALGMTVCEFIVAIVGVAVPDTNVRGQQVLVAFVCIYIAFFASTWGPIAWVIIGEIFPLQIRAKAISLSTASNWLWNFAISYATPYLVNKQKGSAGLQSKVFFIWGSTCAACFVFTYFFIPETKGLSLEQIDEMYQEVMPLNSYSFRRRLIEEGRFGVQRNDSETEKDVTEQTEKA